MKFAATQSIQQSLMCAVLTDKFKLLGRWLLNKCASATESKDLIYNTTANTHS